ncbi:MAG: beta-N-acetylhexosaminidase [Gemmatimonadetes bacterium]|nr:beta-N-acetylhexosaminidase [Gemmatimonadota bacterium]
MRRLALLLCGALLSAGCSDLLGPPDTDSAPSVEQQLRYPVVPLPASLRTGSGAFPLNPGTRIVLSDPSNAELRTVAGFLAGPLRAASGLPLPVSAEAARDEEDNAIVLRLGKVTPGTSEERYRLLVTDRGAELTAVAPVGIFRGVQTIRQLLPEALEQTMRARSPWATGPVMAAAAPSDWTLPAVEIRDAPRFPYRGMHLDVSRHFFPVEFVKEYIDLLALYKFNQFHWHLTDDQGWRVEIRRYPRLTQVGAWRRETTGDGTPYGGFYTQEQIREVVAYAAARYVTIIPEVDMPGHSGAALAAYPEMSCSGEPREVSTTWGIFGTMYCPTEPTFTFLFGVLDEIVDLFPGTYVHTGGDETAPLEWVNSPVAQEVMRREGLTGVDELQSYFNRRISEHLRSRGRRLIGWDEMLDGGAPAGATVMSWRDMGTGVEAARQGHDVIMAPSSITYFDQYQASPLTEPLGVGGTVTLKSVYDFDPTPSMFGSTANRVLGAQGNIWTEHLEKPEEVEYMLLPRMLALSEVVWSPGDVHGWSGFQARLPVQLDRLAQLGIRYRAP